MTVAPSFGVVLAAGRGNPGSSWSSGGSGEETHLPAADGISPVGPSATNREQRPSTVYLQAGYPAEGRCASSPGEAPSARATSSSPPPRSAADCTHADWHLVSHPRSCERR